MLEYSYFYIIFKLIIELIKLKDEAIHEFF